MWNAASLWSVGFVLLWSTGFIGARYGLPYAEPLTLLAVRFAIAAALLLLIGRILMRGRRAAQWPRRADAPWIALVGLMVHGAYLSCVFVAMSWGLEAGAAAVIASMSPLFTAIGARLFLGEALSATRILGLALGFCGVALVVWEKLSAGLGSPAAAALCVLSPVGFAIAAVIQKQRLGDAPMISANVIQYAAACALTAPLALLFETNEIEWTPTFALALAWLVVALSLGAIFLLYMLLRRGEAASVSALTFLVPSATALIAWPLFGETLGPTALAGFALSGLGVALVNGISLRRRPAPVAPRAASPQ